MALLEHAVDAEGALEEGDVHDDDQGRRDDLRVDPRAGHRRRRRATVWVALLKATAGHHATARAHAYIQVYRSIPQKLTVWKNGKIVFTAACNTGIAVRPTPAGTSPVFARYLSTTMSGTNPDGSHYSDPGVPWVADFNGGCAIHGFLRPATAGRRVSAASSSPMRARPPCSRTTPIGTLVTVY